MLKKRQVKGFTLIELLVVVVIIGILAAIALPNFIGAQQKAKISSVKANMHTVQLAAESYATDTGGTYDVATNFVNYLPGGSSSLTGTAGTWPTNPFTNTANEAPADAGITAVADIQAKRLLGAGTDSVAQGKVAYSKTTDNLSYAIMGGDNAGKAVGGSGGKQMVLSNN